jgi:hypothetical protein
LRDFQRLAQALIGIVEGTPLPRTREVRQILAVAEVLTGKPSHAVAVEFRLQRRGLQILAD